MNEYSLLEAIPKDCKILADLMEEFYVEDNQHLDKAQAEQGFKDLLSDNRYGRVWLIKVKAAIAGYIVMTFSFAMEFYGKDGFIDDFFIKKDYRCQGIGKKVLYDISEFARKESIKVLFLEAHDELKSHLLDFYGSVGFSKRPCRLMRKIIEP